MLPIIHEGCHIAANVVFSGIFYIANFSHYTVLDLNDKYINVTLWF